MAECGIATAAHYHEVATGGQCEIDLIPHPLVESADQVVLAKYIIRNVARRNGKTATFMPKPLFGDNGSGMHTHFTLWKDDQPLLAGNGYAGLSDLGMYAIGGLLKHAPALCAFANPTTNSYKRLVPGFEAPDQALVQPAQPRRDRPNSAPQPEPQEPPDRVPRPRQRRESLPALLGDADGGPRRHPEQARPGDPLDKDIYDLQPEELDNVPTTPRSLDASLDALRPTTIPAPRRRLHPRRHRHLDLVQADPRSRGPPRSPASLRVRALLRCVRNHPKSWALWISQGPPALISKTI